jgi:hypothetical protein
MAEPSGPGGGRQQRIGWGRFVAPHSSFSWFVLRIGASALVFLGLLGACSWFFQEASLSAAGLQDLSQEPEILRRMTRASLLNTAVVVVAGVLCTMLMAAYFLHRIAGPIYRIQRHMRGIVDGGPVEEMMLRGSDQLSEFCDTYNQLLYRLDAIEPKPPSEAAATPEDGAVRG